MNKVLGGNLNEKENGDRGWVMGHFPDKVLPYPFDCKNFSLKWSRLKKGDMKEKVAGDDSCQTLTILVSGKHRLDFPETGQSFILSKEGDFAFFEPGVLHTWETLEDSLMVTLRWTRI